MKISNEIELQQTLLSLRAQANSLNGRAKAIVDRVTREGRDQNEAELIQTRDLCNMVDRILKEAQSVQAELDAAEEARLSTPQPRLIDPDPISDSRLSRRSVSSAAAGSGKFADLFGGLRDPYKGGFGSLGEFGAAVAAGGSDSRLIRNASMTEQSGATGGFLVPPQWLGEIFDGALAMEVIRPRALVLPMSGKDLTVSSFDQSDGTDGKRAGLQLLWSAEATLLAEQQARTRESLLSAKKASIFVRVSTELVEDSPNFDRQLRAAITKAVAVGLDVAFTSGTGAGLPLGILNAAGKIEVAKETSQVAATVNLTNLVKMLGRLTPAAYPRAIWMVHPTVLPQLYGMTVTIRNQANTENVGGSAAGVTQSADGTLRIFGIPVAVTDACSVVGTAGDIVLADLSQYVIGLRADARIERSTERYFDTDEIAFRLVLRIDGQPIAAAATRLRDGTNTVSPFVTLATRS